jgi:lipopolysaccharide export system permease protein
MPRLLFLYLIKRIGLGVFIIEFALCVPVVLSYLLNSLPAAAVRGGLVWPAIVGVAPSVAYLALPMAVGVATALEFSRMASEGMIAVLYALRLSAWAICRPALSLALAMVGIGYGLSNFIAPHYAGSMQDVLNVVRNSLNHRMLEPAHFYTFDNGVKTLYLERWETPDIAVNLFVRQLSVEKLQEQTITAAHAEFRRNEAGVVVALTKGSIQTRSLTGGDVRISNFDEYALVLPMQGSAALPQRAWRGVYELSPNEFVAQFNVVRADPRLLAEWATEGAMRLGVPLLSFGHTLLAIALTLTFGNVTGRRGASSQLVIVAIPAAHIAFLVILQSLMRIDARFVAVLAALVLFEILASAFLVAKLNYGPRVARRHPDSASPSGALAAPYA